MGITVRWGQLRQSGKVFLRRRHLIQVPGYKCERILSLDELRALEMLDTMLGA